MPEREDYGSAAIRHARDAALLLDSGRVDNATYLAGYGVECGLKLLVQSGGGPLPKTLGHDLRSLTGKALELAALLSPAMRRYRPDDEPEVRFAVERWSPDLRYQRTGGLDEATARRMLAAAQVCVDRIACALILDGLASFSP
jgi:HEPN domain-containing protein